MLATRSVFAASRIIANVTPGLNEKFAEDHRAIFSETETETETWLSGTNDTWLTSPPLPFSLRRWKIRDLSEWRHARWTTREYGAREIYLGESYGRRFKENSTAHAFLFETPPFNVCGQEIPVFPSSHTRFLRIPHLSFATKMSRLGDNSHLGRKAKK